MDKNGDGAVDEDEAHQRTDADGNGVADAKDAAHDYESFCSEIYEEVGYVCLVSRFFSPGTP